jgi:hypothetical protein
MFILYAIPIGLLAGALLGGRVEGLSSLPLRWVPLALVGLVVQLVLFAGPVAAVIDGAGPPIYVASTLAVFVFVIRNLTLPGFGAIALGSLSNLAAILANGGYMPTTPETAAAAGLPPLDGYSNSLETHDAALGPLTDVFALPPWLPLANVFSVGDILIGVGIALAIVGGMRRHRAGGADARSRIPWAASIVAPIRPFAAAGSPVPPPRRIGRPGAVLLVTPRSMISTSGAWSVLPPAPTVGNGSEIRCSTSRLSRANPSQVGDAKPGIRGAIRVTARLPGRRRDPTVGGVR